MLENGRDYIPTSRWITFGHHFAAIAGPGPLVGPILAAQFGYLPPIIWIVIGAVVGGCVQDFVILGLSLRRRGRSLGQMARTALIRHGKARYAFVTLIPMGWLVAVTISAGVLKVWSAMPNVGFLAHVEALRAELAAPALSAARAAEINRLIFNDRADALMTLIFIVLVAVIIADSARVWLGTLLGARAMQAARMETAA